MASTSLPENLIRLHECEEDLRRKATDVIDRDKSLQLHMCVTQQAMDVLDVFRQIAFDDEDFKVVQALSLRLFNAFGAGIKLALSGYSQNSALIMRDVLETVFLLDYFRRDRSAVARWRLADKQKRRAEFWPVRVREALDKRDGFTEKKRAAAYDLFSELAGHPSMQSFAMLRPKGMDARNGPFIDPSGLEAVISEMGRLAVQVGEIIDSFFPRDWRPADASRKMFAKTKSEWVRTFYPNAA